MILRMRRHALGPVVISIVGLKSGSRRCASGADAVLLLDVPLVKLCV